MHEDSQRPTCCPIVELRQYTLHPGKRDVLIELFDREFVESQEVLGMYVIGQFRDLDNPDRFVWLRGFRNMTDRVEGLTAFYTGPTWKKHRETANATMIDSDNVLLLQPARQSSGFPLENTKRPEPDEKEIPESVVVATICYLDEPANDEFVDYFEHKLRQTLNETGAPTLAYFVTTSAANNFPALPVREGENVFVWFSRFQDQTAYEDHEAELRQRPEVSAGLARCLTRETEVLRLSPTARSLLH